LTQLFVLTERQLAKVKQVFSLRIFLPWLTPSWRTRTANDIADVSGDWKFLFADFKGFQYHQFDPSLFDKTGWKLNEITNYGRYQRVSNPRCSSTMSSFYMFLTKDSEFTNDLSVTG
jgi:hypothetical protein